MALRYSTTYLYLLMVGILLLGTACQPTPQQQDDACVTEAQQLSDSLRDAKQLHHWVEHYTRKGHLKAALIVRQTYGKVLRDASKFEAAIAQHDSCIHVARDLQDTMQLIIALNHQGTNMRRLGDLQKASDLHYEALQVDDHYSDKTSALSQKNRVRSLNGLGNVFLALGNNEAAEQALRSALEGERRLKSATGQAINLANLGSIKQKQGDMDSARIYYNWSMEQNRIGGNAIGMALCYQYLGDLECEQGHYDKATEYYRMGYDTSLPTGDVWHWLESCNALAEMFLQTLQVDSARKYVQQSIEAAYNIRSELHKAEAHALRSQLEEMQGHAAQSLKDLRMSLACQDSVDSKEHEQHVQNLRVNYENNRRIREVEEATKSAEMEKRVMRITLWTASIVLIVLAGTILALFKAYRARKQAQETLTKANEQLTRVNEERQLFYRNLTHQLRTPLTVVVGMVEQLQGHISPEDTRGQQELAATQRQSNELLELVNRLIKASKEGQEMLLTETHETPKEGANAKVRGKEPYHKSDRITPQDLSQREGENGPYSTQGAHILVVEDNDDIALLIQNIFQGHGYVTRRAQDGKEALEMLNDNELPDLIISDIAMPRMDGLELIRHIREDETMNHLPIIIVSARVEDRERLEGLDAGAEAYLAKPFIVEELLLRAHKLLEQRSVLRRKFSVQEESLSFLNNLHEEEKSFLAHIDEIIDAHLGDTSLSSLSLAEEVCISRSQLNRRIKNLTGDDTSHYIRTRRMKYACHLLRTTTLSIGAIETQCGFDTPGYFSRTFRSYYNMSPSEYRKQAH